jgi:hypothetical protein
MGNAPSSSVQDTIDISNSCDDDGPPMHNYHYRTTLANTFSASRKCKCRLKYVLWNNLSIEIYYQIQSEDSDNIPNANEANLSLRLPRNISFETTTGGALLFDATEFKEDEELYFPYGKGFSKVFLMRKHERIVYAPIPTAKKVSESNYVFTWLYSSYNEDYKCQIKGIQWDSQDIKLQFEVRGNYSLGKLQHPNLSNLCDVLPKRVELAIEDPKQCYSGVIIYPVDKFFDGQSLTFRYGRSGYSVADLGALVTFKRCKDSSTSAGSQEIPLNGIKSVHNENYHCTLRGLHLKGENNFTLHQFQK